MGDEAGGEAAMEEADLGGLGGGDGREVGVCGENEVAVDEESSPRAPSNTGAGDGCKGGAFGGKDATFDSLRPPSSRAEAPPRPLSKNPHLFSSLLSSSIS